MFKLDTQKMISEPQMMMMTMMMTIMTTMMINILFVFHKPSQIVSSETN